MNVLILNHEYPPLGGGAGRASAHIAQELVGMGDHVDVLTTSFGDLPAFAVEHGVQVYRVAGRRATNLQNKVLLNSLSYLTRGSGKMRELAKQRTYDVVHCFFTVPAGVLGARMKRKSKTPLVVSLRGSDVPHHNPDEFHWPMLALRPLVKRIWRQADCVVALSEGLAALARRTLPHFDFPVIYNGVDATLFRHPEHQPDEPRGEPVRLVSASRLVELKGLQYLIRALAELKAEGCRRFTWRIIGDGHYRSTLERLVRDCGLDDRVEFLGEQRHEDLPLLYQDADIFVLTSLAESFGQAFAEGMACGLPILGTTVGGIPEVVIDGENGLLVAPRDVAGTKRALRRLIEDRDLRARMRGANIARVRTLFSWREVARQYRDLYSRVKHSAPVGAHCRDHDETVASVGGGQGDPPA